MKKLLLLLGAVSLVGSAAMAEDFRPTGAVKQEVRWYGDKDNTDSQQVRFTLAEGGVRFTDKFYTDYRVRDYMRYHKNEGKNSKELRTRLYYDHGTLGNTKITTRERFGVEGDSGKNKFYYTPEFNFKNYFPVGEHFEVTKFSLRPEFVYVDDNNAEMGSRAAGASIVSTYSVKNLVPGSLDLEANAYFKNNHEANNTTDYELYAYYSLPIGSASGVDFGFYNELGWESTQTEGESVFTSENLYNDSELQASYALNTSTSLYGALAVEYSNYASDQLSDFKFQPYVYVGWKTKF